MGRETDSIEMRPSRAPSACAQSRLQTLQPPAWVGGFKVAGFNEDAVGVAALASTDRPRSYPL
jgi:hypothetical protein